MAQRYLGLTGILVNREIYETDLIPRIEELRSCFYKDSDNKPPLHLSDIMAYKGAFAALKDVQTRRKFDATLMSLIKDVDYQIITVVIDKNSHQDRYLEPKHPYHWSLECMLERYCNFLRHKNGRGDVMTESRGRREDGAIREAFTQFYNSDSDFASSVDIQARLANDEIKIKRKGDLICGLEIADLLALPSKLDVLHAHEEIGKLTNNFTLGVINALQDKYYRGVTQAEGNGKQFLN